MKICFINPPFLPKFSRGQRSPGVPRGGTLYYPYWLCLAAGWAEKQGFEIALFDFCAEGKDFRKAIKLVKKEKPNLVVIETSTPSIYADLQFAADLKKALRSIFILLVGSHVSALPKQVMGLAKAVDAVAIIDAVAIGEYDQTVVETARALKEKKSLAKISGLCFRRGKKLVVTKPRPFLQNLDSFPFVSQVYKKYLDPKKYYFAAAFWPMAMIITGRGCPYGCSFCLWPQTLHGLKYRFRSSENVFAEFEWIKNNLPNIKEIVIEDDTFTANLPRVKKICQLLIKNKNKLPWSTNARVHLNLAAMKLMKKANCRLLIAGYESGSQEVLDAMGKKISLKDSLKFSQNAKKAGLLVHGCFMIGNPGETPKTARQTLEFAKKLNPDSAQFYPLFVYPGTRAYSWAKNKGYLKTSDFSQWLGRRGEYNSVVDLPGFPAEAVVKFCQKAYFEYHLRSDYLCKKIVQAMIKPEEGIRSVKNMAKWLRVIKTCLPTGKALK